MPINASDIQIREARLADLDELADLYCTLWTNSLRNPAWQQRYEELLAQACERVEAEADERLGQCPIRTVASPARKEGPTGAFVLRRTVRTAGPIWACASRNPVVADAPATRTYR